MPGFNGTGPQGMGPMTGRGMGLCGGGQAHGRRGFGRGVGRMSGSNFYRQSTKDDLQAEKVYLEEELKVLNEELKKK